MDVASGYQLWSETYQRNLADVFEVQDEISRAIVATVGPRLSRSARPAAIRAPTANLEAYQLFLRGRFFFQQRSSESLWQSIRLFEQAIALDPGFAHAHAEIAYAYHTLAIFGARPLDDIYPKAERSALAALALDESLPDAHGALGCVALCYRWNWAEADRRFCHALELNPNHFQTLFWYAWYLIAVGRKDEAVDAMRRAAELDVLSPAINARACQLLTLARRYDEALVYGQRGLELDREIALTYEVLGMIYTALGRFEEAIASLEAGTRFPGKTAPLLLIRVLAMAGQREEAARRVAAVEGEVAKTNKLPADPTLLPAIYAALGDPDRAFYWLNRYITEEHSPLLSLKLAQGLLPLHSDPRFNALLRRVGLPES